MTEVEWLACEDVADMLSWLTGAPLPGGAQWKEPCSTPPSDRRLRLFCHAVLSACGEGPFDDEFIPPGSAASPWAARCAAKAVPGSLLGYFPNLDRASILRDIFGNPFRLLRLAPANEWMGVSPRPVFKLGPRLHSPTILGIARDAYDSRRFDLLPVLADALEDAGCQDEALLRHLRGQEGYGECPACKAKPGSPVLCEVCLRSRAVGWVPLRAPHVRGCFALDAILGLS